MLKRGLFLILLGLLAVGCGSDADAPADVVEVEGPSALQVMFASDDFYVGEPRVPIILFDGPFSAEGLQSVDVRLYDLSVDPPEAVWEGPATEYADAPVGYWVVNPPVPTAGNWGLDIAAVTADGTADSYQRSIAVADAPSSPAIGSMPPASENRTVATNKLSELSSGREPVESLYDMTVAEALESGKPTVVTFATPAFCQTQICAPVVSVVEGAAAQLGESANFIHLEIFEDFQELINTPEVGEWGLTSEPWTFVLDADGTVAARLGGPISQQELLETLEPLLE